MQIYTHTPCCPPMTACKDVSNACILSMLMQNMSTKCGAGFLPTRDMAINLALMRVPLLYSAFCLKKSPGSTIHSLCLNCSYLNNVKLLAMTYYVARFILACSLYVTCPELH